MINVRLPFDVESTVGSGSYAWKCGIEVNRNLMMNIDLECGV